MADLLVELETAKRELRVTHDEEDAEIERRIFAAQEQVQLFLGRTVFFDQGALTAALADAPTALSAATAAYNTAMDAAALMDVCAEREANERLAKDAYREAFEVWSQTVRGIVLNDSIRTAILLITASLWEHRGDEDTVAGVPPAAARFLWPYRIGLGV